MELIPHERRAARDAEAVDAVARNPYYIVAYSDAPGGEARAVLLSAALFDRIKDAYEDLTDLEEADGGKLYERLAMENERLRDRIRSLLRELASAKGLDAEVSEDCWQSWAGGSLFDVVNGLRESGASLSVTHYEESPP